MILGYCENEMQKGENNIAFGEIKRSLLELFGQINFYLEYEINVVFFDDEFIFRNSISDLRQYTWIDIMTSGKTNYKQQAVEKTFQKIAASKNSKISDINEFAREFVKAVTDDSKSTLYVSNILSDYSYKAKSHDSSRLNQCNSTCVVAVKVKNQKHGNSYNSVYKDNSNSFIGCILDNFFSTYERGIFKAIFNRQVKMENIIADTGREFIFKMAQEIDESLLPIEISLPVAASALYYNIEKISALAYETDDACGSIVICSKKAAKTVMHEKLLKIEFKGRYDLGKHKMIRKLLQILPQEGFYLISTTEKVFGIIDESALNRLRSITEKLFCVNIKKGRVWEIDYLNANDNSILIMSEYGKFMYPKKELDYRHFETVCKQNLMIGKKSINRLVKIVELAKEQGNGTMVVFSNQAHEEVSRLKNICIPIEHVDLCDKSNLDMVKFITSIDGAILCDSNGECHAIGVILDGKTGSEFEDISRGARFNSAHRYYNAHQNNCVIVIVSEDRDVTVVPSK